MLVSLLTTRTTWVPHLVKKYSRLKKIGVLDLSRSLIVVCFTQRWKAKPFLCLSKKWCRAMIFPSHGEMRALLKCLGKGPWASWGWGRSLTNSDFSCQKGCHLKKIYFFQPKIASSLTSLQVIFFSTCSKLLLWEHRLGTACLREEKENPGVTGNFLTLWEINWT